MRAGLLYRLHGGLESDYWKLLASSAVSNAADGVFLIALPLIAIRQTDSPLLIAGLAIAGRLPWLLFALIAGVLVDRWDRRRTMLAVQLVRAALAVVLSVTVLLGVESLVLLYVTALVSGVCETLVDTASQSLLPSLVRRDHLPAANGRLYAAEIVAGTFVGPPLGGLLVATLAFAAFGLPAVSWLVSALLLLAIARSARPLSTPPSRGMAADIAEGLSYLWGHQTLRTFALMAAVINLAMSAVGAVLVLYAVSPGPMGLSEPAFGLMLTAAGIGGIGGSLVAPRLARRIGRARVIGLAVALCAVAVGTPSLTASPHIVGAGFALGAVGLVMWNVIVVSFRQSVVPEHLLGRVNSTYRLLAWGVMPVGAMVGGVLGELLGLQAVFAVAGLGTLLLLFARAALTEEALDTAELAASAPPGSMPAG